MTGERGLAAEVQVPGILTASLTAAEGITCVVGPNGSGKTTLLRSVAGIVPASGAVRVDGEDWSALPPHRRRTGFLPQQHVLFPHLDVLANVAFGLREHHHSRREARRQAHAWLERFDVAELAGRRPHEISGGQSQRVALARALATDPRVLLLDEPFAALDLGVAQALRDDLAPWLRERVTLLVSHDPVDLFTLSDQVAVLEAGRLVQAGPTADVTGAPASAHVARLVGGNVLRGTSLGTIVTLADQSRLVSATPVDGPVVVTFPPTAVTLAVEEPHDSARNRWPTVVESLQTHGEVTRVRVARPAVRADLTPAAARELGLQPGAPVWASVKATETVVVATTRPKRRP